MLENDGYHRKECHDKNVKVSIIRPKRSVAQTLLLLLLFLVVTGTYQILKFQKSLKIDILKEDRKTRIQVRVIDYHQHSKQKHRDIICGTKSYEKLPDHCSQTIGPREVVIKGERHTGTNLLHKIINTNICHEEVKMNSPDIGWKHGFLPPDGWGKPMSENEILVVQTRDVFSWLPKMFSTTYDPSMAIMKAHRDFSEFIRLQYKCSLVPNPSLISLDNKTKILLDQFLSNNPNNFSVYRAERANNIIKIREKKYKQWLSDDPSANTFKGSKEGFLKNRIHVRLDSIIDDHCDGKNCKKTGKDIKQSQYQLIGRKLLDRCISMPRYDDFQEIANYTKFNFTDSKNDRKFNVQKERKELLQKYTKGDLRFVLSQLDLEFEKQIGYDYSYIYDILKE